MYPSLDEANFVIDWLEEEFDIPKSLKIRVREIDGVYYVSLKWCRAERPRSSELYPPSGWVFNDWQLDEDGDWQNSMYKV